MTELDDVVLMSKADIEEVGLSVLYMTREMKQAYVGEWGSHQYTKEQYTKPSNTAGRNHVKRINPDNAAVRIGSVRLDIGGNIVGKLVPMGALAENARKAMKSKKGIRIIPRLGWEYGQGGLRHGMALKPFIITFDVAYR